MNKLSFDALKERAEATASEELLETISGGVANSCHASIKDVEATLQGWGTVMDFINLLR